MTYSYDRTAGRFPPGWVSLNPPSKVLKQPSGAAFALDLARTEDERFTLQAEKSIRGERSYREPIVSVYVLERDPSTKAVKGYVRLPNSIRGKKPEVIAAWLNQQVEQGAEFQHTQHADQL
jgi:hypothetical protein